MHFYVLIPFTAILVSAAFCAVCVTWNSPRRHTVSMAAIFACAGAWAFLDLMTFLTTDPDEALMWLRWIHLPPLLLGPSVIFLLGHMLPQIGSRLNRFGRLGIVVGLVLGTAAALVPSAMPSVHPTAWGGWVPELGAFSILLAPAGMVLPVMAVVEALRLEGRPSFRSADESRVRALTSVVVIGLLASFSTDFVLPLLHVPAPRLAAFAIALLCATMWLRILHASDDLAITPQGMARAMLEELHDGVVLVQLDGVLLAANARFAEMTGRSRAELKGTSIEEFAGIAVQHLCDGLADREARLSQREGSSLPVSISSSIARNREGALIAAVVVFRDLREVDGLRRKLLTSGRLAAIGELAAGIAHEVNNPIAYIRSDLNLLNRRLGEILEHAEKASVPESDQAVIRRGAGRIQTSLECIARVTEIVGDVRGFAHVGGSGQGGSDPVMLVEGAMRLARLDRSEEVELRVVATALGVQIGFGQELKQVLLALLRTLVGAVEPQGVIEADVGTEGERLAIVLRADRLADDAHALARRVEESTLGDLRVRRPDLGLTIALDVVAQLRGALSVETPTDRAVEIVLDVPLDGGQSE